MLLTAQPSNIVNQDISLTIKSNTRNANDKITINYKINSFTEANSSSSLDLLVQFNSLPSITIPITLTEGSFTLDKDDTNLYDNGFDINSYSISVVNTPVAVGGGVTPTPTTYWSATFQSTSEILPYKLYDVPPPTFDFAVSSGLEETRTEFSVINIVGATYTSFYKINGSNDSTYIVGQILGIQTSDSFNITFTNLLPNTNYDFKIVARLNLKDSLPSIKTHKTGLIPAPSNFNPTSSLNKVTFTWSQVFPNNIESILYYVLSKSTDDGSTWVDIKTDIPQSTLTYTLPGLPFISHKFKLDCMISGVRSTELDGVTSRAITTDVVLTEPDIPLSVIQYSETWIAVEIYQLATLEGDIITYKSYKRTTNSPSYTDSGAVTEYPKLFKTYDNLIPNTSYDFKIVATINGIELKKESLTTYSTRNVPPVQNFSPTITGNDFTLIWGLPLRDGTTDSSYLQPFGDELSYILSKSTNGGTTYQVIENLTNTLIYAQTGAPYGIYKYKIESKISNVLSSPSIVDVVLTPPNPPDTPTTQTGDKSIVVTPNTFSGGNAYGPFTVVMTPTLSESGESTFVYKTGNISKPYAAYNGITPTGLKLIITYNRGLTFIKSTEFSYVENGNAEFILPSSGDTNTFVIGLSYNIILNVTYNSDSIWTGSLSDYIPNPIVAPDAPTLSIDQSFVTEQGIVVNITNFNNSASYTSFYKIKSSSDYKPGPAQGGSLFIFSDLTPGTLYEFKVISTVNSVSSIPTIIEKTTNNVPSPGSLNANLSNGTITLTWTAPTTSNTSYTYNLYKRIDSESWTFIQSSIDKNTTTLSFVPGSVYGVYKFKIETVIATIKSDPVESTSIPFSPVIPSIDEPDPLIGVQVGLITKNIADNNIGSDFAMNITSEKYMINFLKTQILPLTGLNNTQLNTLCGMLDPNKAVIYGSSILYAAKESLTMGPTKIPIYDIDILTNDLTKCSEIIQFLFDALPNTDVYDRNSFVKDSKSQSS